ncbi:dTDP-4-dehydrorhamnose 3,5-epimerase [Campylobacter sp. 2018MI13]|uniref:dTDP-4-dehydrorhamnose 3,5-epimerase n=1 Tax=Campylobacter sp. 2018MI13 TaxID=2836737 RepID=UPI001BD9BD13|nr:dTDP-4-dehydrorhamnose 3,5-epimerase [Campylobacter sp. 2018MI13]MBT0883486.1 dTDP-4-dehydrorhamnose 3,5-epimerase [Campylobacter sp. 2018MI13]
MKITNIFFNCVYEFIPNYINDNRGYFVEYYNETKLNKLVNKNIRFCQDNESKSDKYVLRGLHYQIPPYAQSKLVRVINGAILDVIVDIRIKSPTFGKYISTILSKENKKQIFIPIGFAHGFLTLEENTIINYKVDNYYSKEHERGIIYNDKYLNINWNCDNMILSDKDKVQPLLSECKELFEYGVNYYA